MFVSKIKLRLVVTALFVVTVESLDRKRLAKFPKPARNFDIKSWVQGKWYTQARYVACSFSGSRQHSDIQLRGKLNGNVIEQTFTWRDGLCSTITMLLDVHEHGNGIFVQRDPVGGMMTGNQVVVAYSRKKGYDISWGCTKRSIEGDCADTFVIVKTRARFPKRYVWECIVRDLKRLFDLSLLEMDIVSHKNAC